ncbi:MAG: tyrosine-type recombinase/integrase [Lachnospiraceae bacterium]|nr:tyrosine-type recombinase/integrase [Lachnospiraceae bacterium]
MKRLVNHNEARKKGAKTKKSYHTFKMTDDLLEVFIFLKAEEEKARKELGTVYYDSDYVFKRKNGELYYPDYISEQFRKVIKAHSDLPQDIKFRNLRNSGISIYLEQDMNIKSVQQWARHKNVETTLGIYAKVKSFDAEEQIMECINSSLPLSSTQKGE